MPNIDDVKTEKETLLLLKKAEFILQESAKKSQENTHFLNQSINDAENRIKNMLLHSEEMIHSQAEKAIKKSYRATTYNI